MNVIPSCFSNNNNLRSKLLAFQLCFNNQTDYAVKYYIARNV